MSPLFLEINETLLKACNGTIELKIVSDGILNESYIGVIIGAILGATLAFAADYALYMVREKRELSWYEYSINMMTLDILNNKVLDLDLYDKLINYSYNDLRFSRIKSGRAVVSSLIKRVKGENFSDDLKVIEERQEILKARNDKETDSYLMKLLDKYFY